MRVLQSWLKTKVCYHLLRQPQNQPSGLIQVGTEMPQDSNGSKDFSVLWGGVWKTTALWPHQSLSPYLRSSGRAGLPLWGMLCVLWQKSCQNHTAGIIHFYVSHVSMINWKFKLKNCYLFKNKNLKLVKFWPAQFSDGYLVSFCCCLC